MERVLIISYIISMILTAGFIYCIYREKYWVFEFVNKKADTATCLCFSYAPIIVCLYMLFVTHKG